MEGECGSGEDARDDTKLRRSCCGDRRGDGVDGINLILEEHAEGSKFGWRHSESCSCAEKLKGTEFGGDACWICGSTGVKLIGGSGDDGVVSGLGGVEMGAVSDLSTSG